jgi:HTH-type transcriptional regulator / antitoxin HipB
MTELACTPKQIGAIIQRARTRRGWTQMELAERAGLRQATISTIETGSASTKLNSLLAILAALDLEFLIGPRTKSDATAIEEMFS